MAPRRARGRCCDEDDDGEESASDADETRKTTRKPNAARRARGSAGSEEDSQASAPVGAAERLVWDRGVMKKAKDCIQCHRIITWRKKWEKDWESVRYCSERCKSDAARLRSREAKTSV
eukprot:TRINITY_DN9396_c0_g1_i1.p1 TRINITY_DN9396_c0_g1~~TRINITY_DN9396_c0_g1_i1.p1  ORF type:complete len:119 (+),score=19.25 TRINITY_DN9396_c0_g1_i1:54-410(+)